MGELIFHRGAVTFNLVGGFLLTLPVGLLLLTWYRHTVDLLMRQTTGPAPVDDRVPRPPSASLKLRVDRAPAPGGSPAFPSGPLRRAALIELAAGLAFGLLAGLLVLLFAQFQISPLRLASVALAFAWPSILVLNLQWGPDRRQQLVTVGAYLIAVALLCLLSGLSARGGVAAFLAPLQLWAVYASFSVVLLLFLNRAVRAIGPILVVIAVAALFGANLALSLLATEAGAYAAVDLALMVGGGAWAAFLGTATAGLALGGAAGWVAAGALARTHARKRYGEQILVIDAIWLVQTLVLANSLVIEGGAWGLPAALLPLFAYKLITIFAYRRMVAALDGRQGQPLLFLRVFGFGRRSVKLADLIAARWRHIGPLRLIAAPDVAGQVVAPRTFLAFLRGGLGGLFIRDRTGLERRVAVLDGVRDPDARFRIEELFCAGEMWREAVRRLMPDACAVIMDLRSFGRGNQGCTFELQALVDTVPLRRIFLLVDETTDLDFLRETLVEGWRKLDTASPNQHAPEPELRLLNVAGSEGAAIERLLQEAEALGTPTQSTVRKNRLAAA
jgi:hypothetical protein